MNVQSADAGAWAVLLAFSGATCSLQDAHRAWGSRDRCLQSRPYFFQFSRFAVGLGVNDPWCSRGQRQQRSLIRFSLSRRTRPAHDPAPSPAQFHHRSLGLTLSMRRHRNGLLLASR